MLKAELKDISSDSHLSHESCNENKTDICSDIDDKQFF